MIALKYVTAGSALKDVSLAIRPKECVCVTGAAAELQTLFRVLATLEKPTTGSVEVDNVDVSILPDPVLQLFRSRLGLVFHPPKIIGHLTTGQNIALPLHLRGIKPDVITKAADDLLKRFGLTAKAGMLPSHLNREETQLLCIARCLIAAPLVIVAEEPFADLSDRMAAEAAMLFQNLRKKGATLIFLSRDARTARLMNVEPVTLANGHLSRPETSHVQIPQEETPRTPVMSPAQTMEEEEVIVVTSAPERMTSKPNPDAKETRKIHITSIGSGLA